MKLSITCSLFFFTSLLSLKVGAQLPVENLTLNYEKIEWSYLKEDASKARKSKAFRKLSKKKIEKADLNKRERKVIKRFRKLTRQVVNTKQGSDDLAQGFVRRYVQVENEIDGLTSAGGTSEGKGACMKECADSFPGTGGGNGANRIACKLSCLVLGE